MSGFVHPEYLVTTEWLDVHLDDPNVIVLDCTMHLIPDPKINYQMKPGLEDFEQGHIRGAQFVNMLRDVSDTSQSLPFMRQSPEDFAAAMRRFGVNNTTRVVTYSTSLVWWATRVWWLLHEFGHDNAAVLDGGWQKWQRGGFATSGDSLVLVMLGHKDVKLYDASLNEWAADPTLPMETG